MLMRVIVLLLYPCNACVWFWFQQCWLHKVSLEVHSPIFWKSLHRIDIIWFLNVSNKAIWAWCCLCEKFLKFKFNLFNSYMAIQALQFIMGKFLQTVSFKQFVHFILVTEFIAKTLFIILNIYRIFNDYIQFNINNLCLLLFLLINLTIRL